MNEFSLAPAALDCIDIDGNSWSWFVDAFELHEDEQGRRSVEIFGGPVDPRTWGIASVELDTPEEARWTTEHGTRCVARRFRPYDAVSLGLHDQPLPVEVIVAAGFDGTLSQRPVDHAESRLFIDADTVWFDEADQRERAREIAAVVAYDLEGAAALPQWRTHVRSSHLGWAPAKVPVRTADPGLSNTRFVTPSVAEALWRGTSPKVTREHAVSRSFLATEWENTGGDLDKIADIIWDYRFGVLLTTVEEGKTIDRLGARVGRTERYVAAGIPHLYDRFRRRDIPVGWLDPRHAEHHKLDDIA